MAGFGILSGDRGTIRSGPVDSSFGRGTMKRIAILVLGILLAWLSTGAQTPDAAKLPVLSVPGDTTLLAKLNTNLDLSQSKAGDEVQAETTRDVKEGKDMLLKKGSILIGHVAFVEPASAKQTENTVGIVF